MLIFITLLFISLMLMYLAKTRESCSCVQIKHSLIAYKQNPRTQWVQEWPGQVVLAGSSVYWTEGVERGINTNTMQEFFDTVQVRFNELFLTLELKVERVR